MHMLFKTILRKFIETNTGIKKLILIQNLVQMIEILSESFDKSGILVSKINFVFKLNLLSLYDEYPYEFIQFGFQNFKAIDEITREMVQQLVNFIFKELEYKDSFLFNELYSYDISISAFPLTHFSKCSNREKTHFVIKGHSSG